MNWSEKSALDWDCAERGCFNIYGRPKLKAFKDCLPRNMSFGDVDAALEIGGHILNIEWKSPGAKFKDAQRRYHEEATAISHRFVSLLVEGDPASMACSRMRVIRRGVVQDWEPCTLSSLKERIHRWSHTADERRAGA